MLVVHTAWRAGPARRPTAWVCPSLTLVTPSRTAAEEIFYLLCLKLYYSRKQFKHAVKNVATYKQGMAVNFATPFVKEEINKWCPFQCH